MKPKSWPELVKSCPPRVALEIKAIAPAAGGGTRITWRASTGVQDRDQESIDPMGWIWSTQKLPNLLYGHNGSDPENWIGKGLGVAKDAAELIFDSLLFDESPTQTADLARQIKWIAENHPDALSCSVGFRPLKWQDPNGQVYTIDNPGPSYPWAVPGRKYLEQELLEVSVVPVPSNIEALAVQVRSLIGRAGMAPAEAEPAPEPAPDPIAQIQSIAEKAGIEVVVETLDPTWLAIGVEKRLARPLVKVGAVLSGANRDRLMNAHAACGDAQKAMDQAMQHISDCLGSAMPAEQMQHD